MKPRQRRNLPVIILAVVLLALAVGGYMMIRNLIKTTPPPPKQVVQEIHLIRPPPPPPDQPPPPPPPPDQEKVNVPDPQQQPDPTPSNEPPPSANLGLDAEGGAGGDAFGLVGNKGGREITAGGGGSAFAWYAGLIKDQILNELNGDKDVRSGQYRVQLRAYLNEDGSIKRMELLRGSGDAQRDRAIQAALQRIRKVSQARPAGMPDVITFEVVAHG